MIKMFNNLGIEGNFLTLIKEIYKKHTANITFDGERLSLLPKIRNKTRYLLEMLLFTFIL